MLVGVIAHLRDFIDAGDQKVTADQAEQIRNLELKLAELQAAQKRQTNEDQNTNAKLAEHQIAIAELRLAVHADQSTGYELPNLHRRIN